MSVIEINCYAKWLLSEGSADQSSARIKGVSSVMWCTSIVERLAVLMFYCCFFFFNFFSLLKKKETNYMHQNHSIHQHTSNQCTEQCLEQSPAWWALDHAYGPIQWELRVAYEPLSPPPPSHAFIYFLMHHLRLKWIFLVPFSGMPFPANATWLCSLACLPPELLLEKLQHFNQLEPQGKLSQGSQASPFPSSGAQHSLTDKAAAVSYQPCWNDMMDEQVSLLRLLQCWPKAVWKYSKSLFNSSSKIILWLERKFSPT